MHMENIMNTRHLEDFGYQKKDIEGKRRYVYLYVSKCDLWNG